MCALRSSAPFGRDSVVLVNHAEPDTLVVLGREHPDGSVEGERMTATDWRELLACEEALEFAGPVAAGPNAKCWLLRESFPHREQAAAELRAHAGAILHEEAREGVWIFVVDEVRAADDVERWSRDAFDRAWRLGQQGEWARAIEHADLAWLTDLMLNLDRVALLALAIEQAQGASASEDLIAFELGSRGDRHEHELRQLIGEYRAQFPASPRLAPPLAVRMSELQSQNDINLERWQAKRAVTDRVFPLPRAAPRAPVPGSS